MLYGHYAGNNKSFPDFVKDVIMKLCGCKESCFTDGEKAWGHYGGVMCLHLSERKSEPENIGVCGITKEDVDVYTTCSEYKRITTAST
jgi:hypothetical protein